MLSTILFIFCWTVIPKHKSKDHTVEGSGERYSGLRYWFPLELIILSYRLIHTTLVSLVRKTLGTAARSPNTAAAGHTNTASLYNVQTPTDAPPPRVVRAAAARKRGVVVWQRLRHRRVSDLSKGQQKAR